MVVEDQGRVNYGTRIGEHKGIIGGAALDGEPVLGWSATTVDLDLVPGLALGGETGVGPFVARADFELDEPADLHLRTDGWGKGFAWVNGFNLGRYWRRGPQHTLYVPAPVTRAGGNELVILELEAVSDAVARFVSGPDLGHTEV